MKTNRAFAPSLLVGLVLGSSGAHATTLSLSQASSYNVYILGNMTESNVDSEGRVAVAGNATLTNFGIGSKFSSNPSSAGNALVVGGDLAYNGGEVHYGNTVYGGTLTGNFGHPNGTVTRGSALDFAATSSYLLTASNYWGSLASNGATVNNYGGIQLIGTNSELNVFTLSGAVLASSWGISIDAPAGSTVLVNVTGTSDVFQNMGINFQDINGDGKGVTDKQHVIYNFVDATALSISGISVQGTVLAPKATVTFGNGNIEGQLIAGTLNGSGEAHNYLFTGSLPVPVPEPSSALLTGAAALLMALRRKR